jgi:hypothetical protein
VAPLPPPPPHTHTPLQPPPPPGSPQAFLGAADCLATIADQLEAVVEALGRLAAAVPGLTATCDAFSKDAAGVIAKQARTRQVLGELGGRCCLAWWVLSGAPGWNFQSWQASCPIVCSGRWRWRPTDTPQA